MSSPYSLVEYELIRFRSITISLPANADFSPHDEPVEKNLLNHSTISVVLIEQRLAICCFSCCPTPSMAQIVKFLDALWKTNISPSVFSQLFSVVLGSQHGAELKRRHPSQQRCSKQKSAYLCQQIRRESLLHPLPFYLYTDAVFFFQGGRTVVRSTLTKSS